MSENYFTKLFDIDVSKKTEKKGGLTYLSWAWAWAELKKLHPDAEYVVYENAQGWNYHTDGKTCWVKTGVKVERVEHIEYLPVMDFKNKSISAEQVTSFDVNKAIQRSLTKAIGRHGLGLYIYAGEDLPEETAPQVSMVDRDLPEKKAEKADPDRERCIKAYNVLKMTPEQLIEAKEKNGGSYKKTAEYLEGLIVDKEAQEAQS